MFKSSGSTHQKSTTSVSINIQDPDEVFTYGQVFSENFNYISPHLDYELHPAQSYYGFRCRGIGIAYDWVIHISLKEELANVARAWNKVIWPLVVKTGFKEIKVIRPQALRGEKADGKTVAISLAYHPEMAAGQPGHSKLVAFFQDLEKGLIGEKIESAPQAVCDARIKGSQYTSYRCELGLPFKPVANMFPAKPKLEKPIGVEFMRFANPFSSKPLVNKPMVNSLIKESNKLYINTSEPGFILSKLESASAWHVKDLLENGSYETVPAIYADNKAIFYKMATNAINTIEISGDLDCALACLQSNNLCGAELINSINSPSVTPKFN